MSFRYTNSSDGIFISFSVELFFLYDLYVSFQMFESSSDSIEYVFTEYDGFKIRLLKDHSLWSHVLFNASKLCQRLIKESVIDVRNKSVLELGSGSGLASMQCLI